MRSQKKDSRLFINFCQKRKSKESLNNINNEDIEKNGSGRGEPIQFFFCKFYDLLFFHENKTANNLHSEEPIPEFI